LDKLPFWILYCIKAKISLLQAAIRALNSEETAALGQEFSGSSSGQLSGASSSAIQPK
jgi:hypothetical protein